MKIARHAVAWYALFALASCGTTQGSGGGLVRVRCVPSMGSGIVVRAGNEVITAYHVIEDCLQKRERGALTIEGPSAEVTEASVSFVLPERDLALLVLPRSVAKGIILGQATPTTVLNARGLPDTEFVGHGRSPIVFERPVWLGAIRDDGVLVLAGTFLPGESGAPLFDRRDRVVGILIEKPLVNVVRAVTGESVRVPQVDGLGFAQPTDAIEDLLSLADQARRE